MSSNTFRTHGKIFYFVVRVLACLPGGVICAPLWRSSAPAELGMLVAAVFAALIPVECYFLAGRLGFSNPKRAACAAAVPCALFIGFILIFGGILMAQFIETVRLENPLPVALLPVQLFALLGMGVALATGFFGEPKK